MALLCALAAGCSGVKGEKIRVGSLKGPTSMGILFLEQKAEEGLTDGQYEFRMATLADELLSLIAQGELDIALVPANAAAVLYQRMDGGVEVIDINTLGVLYLVTGDPDIDSADDLEGKKIYLTGMGTTPEASLRYILSQNGFSEDDYSLEFKSEAAEVAAILSQDPDALGLLPQPFATAALAQNQKLRIALDLNEEWERSSGSAGGMVTGVTIVRREFLEENPNAVANFLKDHRESVESINSDPATGAEYAVEQGIVGSEAIAGRAIPECNIVCITGDEMKALLSGYLGVLEEFDAAMVGGRAPDADFYFLGQ